MKSFSVVSLSRPARRRKNGAAFTLVEILTVLAIVATLTAIVIPVRGKLDGITIRGAEELMEAEFALARQTAISRNLPVEMRFYRYNDGTGDGWRMFASLIPASATALVNDKSIDEWITPGRVFSGNVVIDEAYSTLVSEAKPVTQDWVAPRAGTESTAVPTLLQGRAYVAFQFRPDGSTNLPGQISGTPQPWCVSLKNPHGQPASGVPATNYASLILDPLTGRTLSYQP